MKYRDKQRLPLRTEKPSDRHRRASLPFCARALRIRLRSRDNLCTNRAICANREPAETGDRVSASVGLYSSPALGQVKPSYATTSSHEDERTRMTAVLRC